MTLSRSNTPLGERRELHESVQELDELLEDLKNAQVIDERSHLKSSTSSYQYQSSSSLAPTTSRGYASPRPTSASSPTPLRKLAAASSAQHQHELDMYTSRLTNEMGRELGGGGDGPIPRGVFVKDVVEEEILVDHVPVPKQQHSDKKFVTRPADRQQGTRAKRQVAFSNNKSSTTQRYGGGDDDDEQYDNTDNEADNEQVSTRRYARDVQAISDSMQSLNSATGSEGGTSSILDPSKVINCHVCQERVFGQVITALGRNYHREHFTCAHCHQELGTRNFYEHNNLPYCEHDYQQLFSPKCAACQEPILDKVTIALEQTFHPEHFVCAHCGCQFDVDDGFHEKDGKPYCKNDFFDLFANKCAGCQLPITANYITALGVQWHPDCFVCSDCHCPFADGKFFDIDGLPYCEIHYHARRGSLCAVCREPIIGKCTTAMFRKFHPDHFTCTYCLKVLTKSFKEENDKPYCFDCFDKLYS